MVLNAGHIVQAGPPREVLDRPRTPFVARFIDGHDVLSESGRTLGPRSHAIRLTREGGRFARVREVEHRGSDAMVSVDTAEGQELSAVMHDRDCYVAPFEPGEAVGLSWRPEDAHELAPEPSRGPTATPPEDASFPRRGETPRPRTAAASSRAPPRWAPPPPSPRPSSTRRAA